MYQAGAVSPRATLGASAMTPASQFFLRQSRDSWVRLASGLVALAVLSVPGLSSPAGAAEKVAIVQPDARPDAQDVALLIDQHIERRLAAERLPPSALADDAEFIRRAYLDLHGII